MIMLAQKDKKCLCANLRETQGSGQPRQNGNAWNQAICRFPAPLLRLTRHVIQLKSLADVKRLAFSAVVSGT
jgi:hypothetical protein